MRGMAGNGQHRPLTGAAASAAPSGWIALSDRAGLMGALPESGVLERGTLIFEMACPLEAPTVLLDLAGSGAGGGLSLFHDAATGLALRHRQGAAVVRHMLPGALPQAPGVARVLFRWDVPAQRWSLSYERPDLDLRLSATGRDPLPLPLTDLQALCAGAATHRHPALLWFGATRAAAPPPHAPWIGLRTPIATPTGLRPAGNLRPGDMVLCGDGRVRPLRGCRQIALPSRGGYAPVLLRAPFFGNRGDLLVSADQCLQIRGTAVEYLFGEDQVLVRARHLIDHRTALVERRRAVTLTVSLDLGAPGVIASDGIALLSAQHGGQAEPPPCRILDAYEAAPLVAQMRHPGGPRAA
ncbi:Hint domain-containing protein [Gemmobacter aquatilis]|nr:Hint domain-containing protein [Gemmobacter aquatilis]